MTLEEMKKYLSEVIPAGTKIIVSMDAGFAGTDAHEGYILSSDVTRQELEDFAWQRGVDHAEMYGIYPRSERGEEDIDEDSEDSYSDNIEGWWELYDAEKHEGLISYSNGPEFNEY